MVYQSPAPLFIFLKGHHWVADGFCRMYFLNVLLVNWCFFYYLRLKPRCLKAIYDSYYWFQIKTIEYQINIIFSYWFFHIDYIYMIIYIDYIIYNIIYIYISYDVSSWWRIPLFNCKLEHWISSQRFRGLSTPNHVTG